MQTCQNMRWKKRNKELSMLIECPVTNECPGLCLAIKGTSITVCGDIFLFLVKKKKKKTLHPLSPAERVTLCVVSLPASEIHNAYQSMMRHEISGRHQMTCHFCRVPPSPKEPCLSIHRTNLICDWTGHRLCERHHLSMKGSHAACEIWWEETKGRKRKKERRAKYIFNGKEAKGGYGKHPSCFLSCSALYYSKLWHL